MHSIRVPLHHIGYSYQAIALHKLSNRALAEYNGVLRGMPNPELLLSPLTTQEAVLTSSRPTLSPQSRAGS